MEGWFDEEVDWQAVDQIEADAVLRRNSMSTATLQHVHSSSHQALGHSQNTTGAAVLDQHPPRLPTSEMSEDYRIKLLAGQLPPPVTLADLAARIREFKLNVNNLLRPVPPDGLCPGVYGKGCGGEFRLIESVPDLPPFWGCENFYEKSCTYRYYPPERSSNPRLDIIIVTPDSVEVVPSFGAKEAVAACGGVRVLLTLAGCDIDRAELAAPVDDMLSLTDSNPEKESSMIPASSKHAADCSPAVHAGSNGGDSVSACQGLRFPISYYDFLRTALLQTRPDGESLLSSGKGIPSGTLKAFKCSSVSRVVSLDEVNDLYSSLPPSLEQALLPFQREGVRFGLERGGRCLIADEMGVGKTVQAIALAACYRDTDWPLLIVCPASLRLVWAEELEKWLPDLSPASIHIISDRTDRLQASSSSTNNNTGAPQEPSQCTERRSTLPQITITSFRMLEHLCCGSCKRSKKWRELLPREKWESNNRACLEPAMCMASLRWNMILVDESHALRTSPHEVDAQHTEAIRSISYRAKRLVFLSGTPSLSKPFDLFNQVDILRPGLLGANKIRFAEAYCQRRLIPSYSRHNGFYSKVWDNSGLARAAELHLLLRREVMVRRVKRDVLSQLPAKRRQVIRLPKPKASDWPKVDEHGRHTVDDSDAEDDDSDTEVDDLVHGVDDNGVSPLSGQAAPARRMSTFHRTGIAKCPSAIEWLQGQLGITDPGSEEGGVEEDASAEAPTTTTGGNGTFAGSGAPKVIVFAHHRTVINRLAAAFDGVGTHNKRHGSIHYVVIQGETEQEERRQAVESFRNDPRVWVALLSVTAAGTGLDFSAASAVVFVELPSEVSLVRQAEDRAHRQGQRRPVNVYFLCARGTTDERRWQKLDSSLARIGQVHDGPLPGVAAPEGAAGGTRHKLGNHDLGGPSNNAAAHVGEAAGLLVDRVITIADGKGGNMSGPSPHHHHHRQQLESLSVSEEIDKGRDFSEEEEVKGELSSSSGGVVVVPEEVTGADADRFWFEVSGNTRRVHFHAAPDRSAPLRISLSLEALCVDDAPAIEELIRATAKQLEHRSIGSGESEGSSPITVISGVGLAAVNLDVIQSVSDMRSAVVAARGFAREWRELRAAVRSRLVNKLLQAPLDDAVERAAAVALSEGALGTARERFLRSGTDHNDIELPKGAIWQMTQVNYSRLKKIVSYHQAVLTTTQSLPAVGQGGVVGQVETGKESSNPGNSYPVRCCIHCMKEVPGSGNVPLDTVLTSPCFLFCGPDCERRYAIKSSGTVGRRRLFQRDRGICQKCMLDCAALVRRLQAVERGTKSWRERRRQLLQRHYPEFVCRAGDKAVTALVERATSGQVWQSDHIVAVYQGGGQCDIDNLRTLCGPCHKIVTRQQALERAKERREMKMAAVRNGEPARCRTKRQSKVYIDESEDGNEGGRMIASKQRGSGRSGGMRRGRRKRGALAPSQSADQEHKGTSEIEFIDLT